MFPLADLSKEVRDTSNGRPPRSLTSQPSALTKPSISRRRKTHLTLHLVCPLL